MLVYRFRASSGNGFLEGEVVALSPARALKRLRRIDPDLELERIRVDLTATINTHIDRWFPVSGLERAQFFRQLHLLFTSGMELSRAVRTLAESSQIPRLRKALFEVDQGLQEGNMFSDMLRRHPAIFPTFLVGMVAVGEQTGSFQDVLDRAATLLEKDYDRLRRVQSALVYPAFLACTSLALFVGMLLVFLPRMAEVLGALGTELPLAVKVMLAGGRLLSNTTAVVMTLMLLAAMLVTAFLWVQTPRGRRELDRLLLRIPVLNRVFLALALSRFSFAMCLVVRSGMPLSAAMSLLSASVGNRVIGESIQAARERLEQGDTLSESLEFEEYFKGLFRQMIEVGEESSRLDSMLEHVQRIYSEELDLTLETATSLIEPVIMVVMGVLVGGMVIAFMLPLSHMVSKL